MRMLQVRERTVRPRTRDGTGPPRAEGRGAAWTPPASGENNRVPADYQKIREENIARYGWDTAVLDLLGQLYLSLIHI